MPRVAHAFGQAPLHPESTPFLQAKLRVSAPGDTEEREADSVSDQVTSTPRPQFARATPIQPVTPFVSAQIPAPPSVHDVLRSPGEPLAPEISAFMEPRFGYDFSRVRVHSSAAAQRSASDVDASAYTVGPHIVFARGQYAPQSVEGRRLIAHELTHVVQQTATPARDGLLARRPAPGHADSVEFRAGKEISATLVSAARRVAAGGVTKDELKVLRSTALSDQTIDHEERGFLAGLLDNANASKVATGGTSFVFTKASIEAHLAEVADLERPLVDTAVTDAMKKKWIAVAQGKPAEIDTHMHEEEDASLAQMKRLVERSREPKLALVVDYAAANGVKTPQLLTAMLAGASDSTPDDMLMAAIVYAVAAAANHDLQFELLRGTIKVDQVPKAQLPVQGAGAVYVTEGSGKGKKAKGDTIYIPESISVDNAAHRSVIIHELEHARQDRMSSAGLMQVDAELDAYRAGAKYLLEQIAQLPNGSAKRDAAVKDATKIMNPILIRALILESRRDSRFEMVIVDINSEMPEGHRLSIPKLARVMAMDNVELMIEAKDEIIKMYDTTAGAIMRAAGFGGEHDTNRM